MALYHLVNGNRQGLAGWRRLAAAWGFILAVTLVGSCTLAYLLLDDWREGVFMGLVLGAAYAAVITHSGSATPIDRSRPGRFRSSSGARHA